MSLTALALVLLGALIHAGWNIVAKIARRCAIHIFQRPHHGRSLKSTVSVVGLECGADLLGTTEWLLIAASGFLYWVYFDRRWPRFAFASA